MEWFLGDAASAAHRRRIFHERKPQYPVLVRWVGRVAIEIEIPGLVTGLRQHQAAEPRDFPAVRALVRLLREASLCVRSIEREIVLHHIATWKAHDVHGIEPVLIHVFHFRGDAKMVCLLWTAQQAAREVGWHL